MVVWLIGMSGAGKTVIGTELHRLMKKELDKVVFLDGDVFREILGNDLGHTVEDRRKSADRVCKMCKFLDENGIHVVAAILSIFPESREWNRQQYNDYFEVFVDVEFEELKRRDSKGLYSAALAGQIKNVVGVDIDFPKPECPDVTILNNGKQSPEIQARNIFQAIISKYPL